MKTNRIATVRMVNLVQSRLDTFMKKTTNVSSSITDSNTASTAGSSPVSSGGLNPPVIGNRLGNLITDSSWRSALNAELNKPYALKIESFLATEYSKNVRIFPPRNQVSIIFGNYSAYAYFDCRYSTHSILHQSKTSKLSSSVKIHITTMVRLMDSVSRCQKAFIRHHR